MRTIKFTRISGVNLSNENGFTLLEMMVSFFILSILVLFLAPMFQLIQDNESIHVRLQQMEWDVFCSQAKKEIRMANKAETAAGKLVLTNDTNTVVYELFGNKLRRRVNFSGHEILLQNIHSADFSIQKSSVRITIKSESGSDRSVLVHSFIDWEAKVK